MLATLDGFAVEGGFDVPYGPSTNFLSASSLSMCSTPGSAEGLWANYESVVECVPELGLDGVRVTLEWARLEPRRGQIDALAIERYRRLLAHTTTLGLRRSAVIVDAAWPAWLGAEAWLLPWVGPVFADHVRRVAEEFGDLVDALVLFARPVEMVDIGFLHGAAPPWRHGASRDAEAAHRRIDQMVAAASADPVVGPLVVRNFTEVPVVRSPEALAMLIDAASGSSEVHLRSLVRGAGPTSSATPILERHGDTWSRAVSNEIVDTWTHSVGN